MTALGVLCCFALIVVCLTLLASFFLSSLIKTCTYNNTCTCTQSEHTPERTVYSSSQWDRESRLCQIQREHLQLGTCAGWVDGKDGEREGKDGEREGKDGEREGKEGR